MASIQFVLCSGHCSVHKDERFLIALACALACLGAELCELPPCHACAVTRDRVARKDARCCAVALTVGEARWRGQQLHIVATLAISNLCRVGGRASGCATDEGEGEEGAGRARLRREEAHGAARGGTHGGTAERALCCSAGRVARVAQEARPAVHVAARRDDRRHGTREADRAVQRK